MDKTTMEVRHKHWEAVIKECLARPEGQSIKQWCDERGISTKTYYYWQQRLRLETYNQMKQAELPVAKQDADITFAEPVMPEQAEPATKEKPSFNADAVIQTGKFTIGLSNSASQPLIRKILEGISHAS